MIDRYYGQYTPVCDFCEGRLPGCTSFRAAVQEAKDEGWKIVKNEHGYFFEDMCPECQEIYGGK